MPTAASHVDMMTESRRMRSTSMPQALANTGFEPTAVMAVPVLVCRNAHMPKASSAKNAIVPMGMTRLMPQILLQSRANFASTLSSVSYTHLDVYKRQILIVLHHKNGFCHGVVLPVFFCCSINNPIIL